MKVFQRNSLGNLFLGKYIFIYRKLAFALLLVVYRVKLSLMNRGFLELPRYGKCYFHLDRGKRET